MWNYYNSIELFRQHMVQSWLMEKAYEIQVQFRISVSKHNDANLMKTLKPT